MSSKLFQIIFITKRRCIKFMYFISIVLSNVYSILSISIFLILNNLKSHLQRNNNQTGDTSIKVWDMVLSGRLLYEINSHHKNIMSIKFNNDYTRLLSAGLDGLLCCSQFKTISINYKLTNSYFVYM